MFELPTLASNGVLVRWSIGEADRRKTALGATLQRRAAIRNAYRSTHLGTASQRVSGAESVAGRARLEVAAAERPPRLSGAAHPPAEEGACVARGEGPPRIETRASRRHLLASAATLCGLQEASSALAVGTIGAGSSKAIFQELISRKVKENVTAPYGVLMQLLLYDAWSLDVSAKSGGVDGSIRLVEGLDAPVAAAVDEINRVKAAFDADEAALAPISWSDALVIAGLEKVKEEFRSVREARGISAAQGNAAPNPKLGRGDAQVADAPATVEALASLSTASQYKCPTLARDKTRRLSQLCDGAACSKQLTLLPLAQARASSTM
ncbi:hypothetical protein CYMTET_22776 [Cymbomonas tetramitiformis]|uniref:Uncharacterized protein n=1 Tax=Cymbomonas tetramitiformis TaxID=36881 RepID=A0AAE0FZJ0_9CHLO|nr:hypothetical protein CYMTET_22776 [Cymbomonas tetramitiformis]